MESKALFPALSASSQDDPDVTFGEIRALLTLSPSVRVWRALWERLQTLPDEFLLDACVQYVAEHIGHWPDGLREAPNDDKPLYYSTKHQKKADSPKMQALLTLIDSFSLNVNQTFGSGELRQFAQNPQVQHLTHLDLYLNHYIPESFAVFAQSEHLSGLASFTLRGSANGTYTVRTDQVNQLSASPWFRGLKALHMNNLHASYDEVATWDGCVMPNLRHLRMNRATLDALLSTWLDEELPPLEELFISHHLPERAVMHEFMGSIGAASLRSLTCEHLQLLDPSSLLLPALLDHGAFPHLETLRLSQVLYNAGQLRQLLGETEFVSLVELELSQLGLGWELATYLRELHVTPQLRSLTIQFDEIRLAESAEGLCFDALETLDLRGSCRTEEDLDFILQSDAFPSLRKLCIGSNQLNRKKARKLGEAHQRRELTHLDISGNQVGDELILSLVNHPSTPQLERLDCANCGMSVSGMYTLLSAEDVSASLQKAALLDLLEASDRVGLQRFVRDHIPRCKLRNKSSIVALLHEAIATPAQRQAFLRHSAYIDKLTKTGLSETLKAFGKKGFSKLRVDALRTWVYVILEEHEGEIPLLGAYQSLPLLDE